MAQILDGKIVRDTLKTSLKDELLKVPHKLTLVILQVGERPDSTAFINQKKRLGEDLGVIVVHKQYNVKINEHDLKEEIEKYNKDTNVHGIILQIPLPDHLNKNTLLNAIHSKKDIDGLNSYNTQALFDEEKTGHIPATARGIITLLNFYKIKIEGKRVVIVGRSNLVGKRVALTFLRENATITVAHKHTVDLPSITRTADILVIAIGDPQFITKSFVSPGQIVIDVGINRGATGKLVGDILTSEVEPIVKAITPVPGGVGPMTVISLFQNLLDAYNYL
jgi:methylenetetrahydrofolate dehydrogenase (NADP+)/methenyltetrahydrofolate cyclohydrolase